MSIFYFLRLLTLFSWCSRMRNMWISWASTTWKRSLKTFICCSSKLSKGTGLMHSSEHSLYRYSSNFIKIYRSIALWCFKSHKLRLSLFSSISKGAIRYPPISTSITMKSFRHFNRGKSRTLFSWILFRCFRSYEYKSSLRIPFA